jgi:hypothetical protein
VKLLEACASETHFTNHALVVSLYFKGEKMESSSDPCHLNLQDSATYWNTRQQTDGVHGNQAMREALGDRFEGKFLELVTEFLNTPDESNVENERRFLNETISRFSLSESYSMWNKVRKSQGLNRDDRKKYKETLYKSAPRYIREINPQTPDEVKNFAEKLHGDAMKDNVEERLLKSTEVEDYHQKLARVQEYQSLLQQELGIVKQELTEINQDWTQLSATSPSQDIFSLSGSFFSNDTILNDDQTVLDVKTGKIKLRPPGPGAHGRSVSLPEPFSAMLLSSRKEEPNTGEHNLVTNHQRSGSWPHSHYFSGASPEGDGLGISGVGIDATAAPNEEEGIGNSLNSNNPYKNRLQSRPGNTR